MGGSGVQRPLKFIKYLREFGWNPIVLCPEPGAYHVFDESLNSEVKSINIEVHRVKGNTLLHKSGNRLVSLPVFLENILRSVSQFFWLPDNKKGWVKPGFEKAQEIIVNQKIDLVFSSAPPYSNLILAKKIKKKFNIPVVMDLRDEWLESHLIKYPTRWHFSKMKKLEQDTLSYADKIITINERMARSIDKRKVNASKVEVITHGFDPADFENDIDYKRSKKIRFLYSGTFYPESGPELFIQAMSLFLSENPEYRKKVELQFQGNLSENYTSFFKRYDLQNQIVDFGFVHHDEAIHNLLKADVLWLNNSHKKNPDILSLGKTYEYMASKKPILAIVSKGELKNTLEEYKAALISEPEDVNTLKNNIERIINVLEKEKVPSPNQLFINKFNRKELTKKLASIFNVISAQ